MSLLSLAQPLVESMIPFVKQSFFSDVRANMSNTDIAINVIFGAKTINDIFSYIYDAFLLYYIAMNGLSG